MELSKTEEFLAEDMESASYPLYLQLANTVVCWQDKVLLIYRRTEPFKDYWSIPGGGVEIGESYRAAAARELDEEVGIVPAELNPIGIYVDHTHKLESHLYIVISHDGVVFNPEPDEQDSATWKTIDEAVQLKLTPGIQWALTSLHD